MQKAVLAHVFSGFVLLSICVGLFLLAPQVTEAQGGLVTCTSPNECGTCEFVAMLQNVFQWLVGIASIAATIFIILAGIRLTISGGDTAAREFTKKVFLNIFFGFLLVLGSFAIVSTIIRVLVPSDSPILSWNQVECIRATPPTRDESLSGGAGRDTQTGGAFGDPLPGAGSCTLGPTGSACDPNTIQRELNISETQARQMSGICMRESGGRPVESTVDRCCGNDSSCSNADSFSGGYFQINILAHYERIPGCDPNFFTTNGSGELGDCIHWTTVDTAQGQRQICSGYSCTISDRTRYDICMQAVRDRDTNYEVAGRVFRAAEQTFGNPFQPWSTTAVGGACENLR